MSKIIIIDDDKKSMEFIELAIELDLPAYNVVLFQYPKQFIDSNPRDVKLIILDIMFAGDGEFDGGFDLGLEYYQEIKEIYQKTPIILFTNKSKELISEPFKLLIEENGDQIIEKPSVSLDGFIVTIKDLLEEPQK